MKPYLSLLALALSTTLFAAGCNRDRDADATPAADAAEPAMAPEPAPMGDAMSAPIPGDSGMSFAEMDKNQDGGIVHQELADTEMLHKHFSDADTDGDGKLSSAEVDAHRAHMAANPAG